MSDFYEKGYNDGYGYFWKNSGYDRPRTDGEWHSYQEGIKNGRRRRSVADEIDIEHEYRSYGL